MEQVQGFTRGQRIWARVALVFSFLLVGGVAAVMSYFHIRDVALIAHQGPLLAGLMPLAIDGMMLIATVAMLEDKASNRYPRPWARFGFWVGALVSTAANISSIVVVWGWYWLGVVGAGLPPLLLMLSVEIVSKPGRLRAVADAARHVRDTIRHHTSSASAATSPTPATTPAAPAAGNGANASPAQQPASVPAQAGVMRSGRPQDEEPLPERLVMLARQVGAAFKQRTGRDITRIQLREDLARAGWTKGISNVTATRLLALLRSDQNDGGDQEQGEPVAATAAANGHA